MSSRKSASIKKGNKENFQKFKYSILSKEKQKNPNSLGLKKKTQNMLFLGKKDNFFASIQNQNPNKKNQFFNTMHINQRIGMEGDDSGYLGNKLDSSLDINKILLESDVLADTVINSHSREKNGNLSSDKKGGQVDVEILFDPKILKQKYVENFGLNYSNDFYEINQFEKALIKRHEIFGVLLKSKLLHNYKSDDPVNHKSIISLYDSLIEKLTQERHFFTNLLETTLSRKTSLEKCLESSLLRLSNKNESFEINCHGELAESDALICQENIEMITNLSEAVVLSTAKNKKNSVGISLFLIFFYFFISINFVRFGRK